MTEDEVLATASCDRFEMLKPQEKEVSGSLQIKGDSVFRSYFNRPVEVSSKEFAPDGWFKTGDVASMDEIGDFKILGRSSVDIIKQVKTFFLLFFFRCSNSAKL